MATIMFKMLHVALSNDVYSNRSTMNTKMLLLFGFVGKTGPFATQRSGTKFTTSSAKDAEVPSCSD